MSKVLAATAFALFTSAAHGADASGAAIHSNPATEDNLRVYAIVEVPIVTFVLDGGAPSQFPGMSVMFTRLAPGRHDATLALPDGSQASLDFTLSADSMIESKGRRWWCLMAGRRDGRLSMLQPTTAQCKAVADAGPD